jgi:NADH-quinone oxidoreductase subunit M
LIALAALAFPLAAAMACAVPALSRAARAAAVLASLAVAALGIAVLVGARSGPLRASWATPLGTGFAVDLDLLSAVFVTLVGIVFAAAAASSERIGHRRAYFALLDLLLAAMVGTFVARDLLLFFVCWDAALVPLALLMWQWGDRDRRGATQRMLLQALAGSALLLVGIVSLAVARGTLDIDALAARRVPSSAQLLPAMLVLAGLAVRLPLFPLHGWLPRAFASAPIPAAIAIGGAMCASAAYAILRIPLYLFPDGMADAAPLLVALAAVGAVYGAVAAATATDLRRIAAFATLAQANVVALGLFASTPTSLRGATFAALSNGITVAIVLVVAGAIARRTGSFSLSRAGGLAGTTPALAACAIVATFALVAVPGTSGFPGLFLALAGAYERFPASTVFASLALVAAPVFALRAHRRAFQGPPLAQGADLRRREALVLVPLLALVLLLGVAPRSLNDRLPDNALPSAELIR